MPPRHYRIRVSPELSPAWAARFAGLALAVESPGVTVMTGMLPDQAALHGVLASVRDLGLTLVSIQSDDGLPKGTHP